MKPDWKDAPEWAQWLAMDCNGIWTWFECEPRFSEHNDWWWCPKGRTSRAYTIEAEESLEARPS